MIKDKNLELYLNIVFNKKLEDITKEELSTIKTVSYENNTDPNKYILDLSDLDNFPNLEGINFHNVLLRIKDLKKLKEKKIKKLRLHHCAIDDSNNLSLLNDLETFESIDSYHESYDFLKSLDNLTYLAITNPYTKEVISLNNLIPMTKLKKLALEQCPISEVENLKECKEIEYMNLLGTDLPKDVKNIIKELSNLKKLYIDENIDLGELEDIIEVKNTLFEFPEGIDL